MKGHHVAIALSVVFTISVFMYLINTSEIETSNVVPPEELSIAVTNNQLEVAEIKRSQANPQQPTNDVNTYLILPTITDDIEARASDIDCSLDYSRPTKVRLEQNLDYFNSLASADSIDERLYHALFATTTEGSSKFDQLYNHFQQDQTSPLLSNALLNLCAESLDERCDKALIERLVIVDKYNGMARLSAAAFYANSGDDIAFTNNVEELAKTAFFNERHGEWALTYVQALSGEEGANFNLDAMVGIGIHSTTIIPVMPIIDWCEADLDNSVKADTCMKLGQELTARGTLEITRSIGSALQSTVYRHYGDKESLDLLDERRKEFLKIRTDESFNTAEMMMFSDESLMRQFLHNIDNIGELEAIKLVIDENQSSVAKYQQNCRAKADTQAEIRGS
ncbi:hypothetical protein [Thalassotalea montiporae]